LGLPQSEMRSRKAKTFMRSYRATGLRGKNISKRRVKKMLSKVNYVADRFG
jgi:hypothetical protein